MSVAYRDEGDVQLAGIDRGQVGGADVTATADPWYQRSVTDRPAAGRRSFLADRRRESLVVGQAMCPAGGEGAAKCRWCLLECHSDDN
jgi:hypothetical protein